MKVPIEFILEFCQDCGMPYLVLEIMEGRCKCPHCTYDKMYSSLLEKQIVNNELHNESVSLKRSNASLKGVITKQAKKIAELSANESTKKLLALARVKKTSYSGTTCFD